MIRIVAILGLALGAAACHPAEGERCNPALFSDECADNNNGLSCVYPPNCGVAYCCPAADKLSSATNSNCNACAALDGGAD